MLQSPSNTDVAQVMMIRPLVIGALAERPAGGREASCLRPVAGALAAIALTVLVAGTAGFAEASVKKPSQAALAALQLATHHYKKEHFAKAAALYLEAFELDPNPAFLYNAARSQQRAFLLDQAKSNFKWYLKLRLQTGSGQDKGVKKAKLHLREIESLRRHMSHPKGTSPAPAATLSQAVTATGASSSWRRSAGLTAAGVGALVALGGLGWHVSLDDEQTSLNALTDEVDKGKSVSRVSYGDWRDQQDDINSRRLNAHIALGVGAVALATGTWWLLAAPSATTVTVLPTTAGATAMVSVRF